MSAQSLGYPINVIQRARVLRAGGWSLREVSDLVERETGHRPSPTTVKVWCDKRYARRSQVRGRVNTASRRARESGGRFGRGKYATAEFKVERIRALRELGLSAEKVARLVEFDCGDPLSAYHVRRVLDTGCYPELRRLELVA